ncbi:MAG: hypothetical protein R2764_05995 [Bacteroidales bacterium]
MMLSSRQEHLMILGFFYRPWNATTLVIESGASLRVYDEILTVHGDLEIYGQLQMDHASGVLNIENDIYWKSGSGDLITSGTINVHKDWWFEDGTSASLSLANTVNFVGVMTSLIHCEDADAEFGSIGIHKTNLATWIHSSSTQIMRVTGDMTIGSGDIFHVQGNDLEVDGILDVANTGTMYLSSGGTMTNHSDFVLNGTLEVGLGDVMIHGEFDLETSGTLTIDGGSFICDEGLSSLPFNIRGTFNMTDGLFQSYEYFGVESTAYVNVSGGTIRVQSFWSEYPDRFAPTGGIVELYSDFVGQSITNVCSNGSYFHNLHINYPSCDMQMMTDIIVNNDLEIIAGHLWLNGNTATVVNDVKIFGGLKMENASDVLQVYNDIIWESGSYANMTTGLIEVTQNWYFNDGTNCQIGTGNVVKFMPSFAIKILHTQDSDAQFGSVIVDAGNLYLDGYNTEPVHISGNLTVNSSKTLWMQNKGLIVDGNMNIQNGGTIKISGIYSGGSIENNSDFVLYGILEVGIGDVLIHGKFDLALSGELIIEGGSFVYDGGTSYSDIDGTINLSDGLFQGNEQLFLSASSSTNITGGIIRTTSLMAEHSGTFEPSGGTVEIQTDNNTMGAIYCSNGNFLHNLKVNPIISIIGGAMLLTDVWVQNDLEITGGLFKINGHELTVNNNIIIFDRLKMDDPNDVLYAGDSFGDDIIWKSGSDCGSVDAGTINVFGDWTFENGTDGQIAVGNTVNFYGNNNSTINCDDPDVEFGNLTINKTSATHYFVQIPSSSTIRIAEDLNIYDGELEMNENTEIYVQNELNVQNGGILSVIGTPGNGCIVSAYPNYGIFEVMSGGTISAEYTTFEYFEGAGVVVANGATIDPLHPFTNCTFTEGTSGGKLLTINNNQILTIDGANFPANTWSGTFNVSKTLNQGQITFTNFSGDFSDEPFENDPYDRIIWDHEDFYLNVRLYLEGPFNTISGMMNPTLNSEGLIPLSQPYNTAPWNYNGSESVVTFDPTTIDWVLVELRDAPDAASATPATTIARKALFVKTNGYIVELAGTGFPVFNVNITQNLFVVVWHRNHLGIMSAFPLVESGGVYTYDFRGSASQAYGGTAGYTQLLPSGYWGMVGGDGNSDGEVTQFDKTNSWNLEAGSEGYKAGDYNLDSQVGNQDKNNILMNNLTKVSQVPE